MLKMYVLSLEWNSEGVMDAESGDDDKDGLTSKWGMEKTAIRLSDSSELQQKKDGEKWTHEL